VLVKRNKDAVAITI